MNSEMNPLVLLVYAKWAIISIALLYILMVFGLSMLAARLGERSAWTAWIPLVNFYLMCRLANASVLLILPMLIPVLNLIVFGYLGAQMARRVGRSPILGALFGVPVVGAAVPLLLAAGKEMASSETPGKPVRPPFVSALIQAGVAIAFVVVIGTGFAAASRMSQAIVPTVDQAVAALPQRVAGTLTEFPIDTDAKNPASPTQVVYESFALPVEGEEDDVDTSGVIQDDQLPPWITRETLAGLAENATAAEYLSADATAPVSVVALAMRERGDGELVLPTQQQLADISPDATLAGLELQTVGNLAYRGYRVSTPDSAYIVLRCGDTNVAMMVSASTAAGIELAERLVRQIGNGQGLLEYEQYRSSFGQLPAAPPAATLQIVTTLTEADLVEELAKLDADAGNDMDPQGAAILPLIRAMMPRTITIAGYAVENPEDGYFAAVAGYSSSSNAWTAVQTLRVLQGFIPPGVPVRVTTIDVGGRTAIAVDVSDADVHFGAILLRQESSVAVLGGLNTTSQDLRAWAESYALGR